MMNQYGAFAPFEPSSLILDKFITDKKNHSTFRNHYAWEIEEKDIVVVPSLSFDAHELSSMKGVYHYEERMLFVLLALANPSTRITYVTSSPIDSSIVEYYFSLLPSDRIRSSMNRMTLLTVDDGSETPLTQKLLQHPTLLNYMKQKVIHPKSSILKVLRGTSLEERLASQLHIPLYSARPEQQSFGNKAGSRTLFRKLGIPLVDGTYDAVFDTNDLVRDILDVVKRNPNSSKGVVKLSEGFSGKGNAILDLTEIRNALMRRETSGSSEKTLQSVTLCALRSMEFCGHGRCWTDDFENEVQSMGAIFELFIDGDVVTSPSVQGVVTEYGTVQIISTHDQILEGQVYVGCEFPCREEYRIRLMKYGERIGKALAEEGVADHFAVDFMAVQNKDRGWDLYAVEINLRITGTTHPWMTMKLLTHGQTDNRSGLFRVSDEGSSVKYYVASDNIEHQALERLLPRDVMMLMKESNIHWCPKSQTGVVMHLLGCLVDGKMGMTAIANSSVEARMLFQQAKEYIIEKAKYYSISN